MDRPRIVSQDGDERRSESQMEKSSKAIDEAQIRQLIESWTMALRAKDIDALLSRYTPEILSYGLAPPLAHRGLDVHRRSLEAWFPTFQGPIGYDVHDLSIAAGGDVAFSTSLNRLSGSRTNGEQTNVWVRSTVGYRKADAKWAIAHAHSSVPFYMDGSYKAAVDLEP